MRCLKKFFEEYLDYSNLSYGINLQKNQLTLQLSISQLCRENIGSSGGIICLVSIRKGKRMMRRRRKVYIVPPGKLIGINIIHTFVLRDSVLTLKSLPCLSSNPLPSENPSSPSPNRDFIQSMITWLVSGLGSVSWILTELLILCSKSPSHSWGVQEVKQQVGGLR